MGSLMCSESKEKMRISLARWLGEEVEWVNTAPIMQQTDGVSCGVHTMMEMAASIKALPGFQKSMAGLDAFRAWLIVCLFCGKIVSGAEGWMGVSAFKEKWNVWEAPFLIWCLKGSIKKRMEKAPKFITE